MRGGRKSVVIGRSVMMINVRMITWSRAYWSKENIVVSWSHEVVLTLRRVWKERSKKIHSGLSFGSSHIRLAL